jgi:CO/xanthine dehydrogenase FAD-binding subunit
MARPSDVRVFSPSNLQDALSALARNPDATVFAGGTSLLCRSPGTRLPLSGAVIPIAHLEELKLVHRTERYLDLGACVTLASLLELGERIVPDILIQAASGVARAPVQNLATIGGNVASAERRMDLHPVLTCLDAQAELRRENAARWLPVSQLPVQDQDQRPGSGAQGPQTRGKGPEIICRVRVPLDSWNISIYKKIGSPGIPDVSTFSFVFLARAARGFLSDMRVCLSGKTSLRRRDIEAGLAGKRLPLSASDAAAIVAAYGKACAEEMVIPSLRRIQFLSLLERALSGLSA